jgi:hypothetical protein
MKRRAPQPVAAGVAQGFSVVLRGGLLLFGRGHQGQAGVGGGEFGFAGLHGMLGRAWHNHVVLRAAVRAVGMAGHHHAGITMAQ